MFLNERGGFLCEFVRGWGEVLPEGWYPVGFIVDKIMASTLV